MQAPIGYLNRGSGKPKIPDPTKAPLIRQVFELYATGAYSLKALQKEMYARGLRNNSNGRITLNGLSCILNNPFYMGVIRLKRTGEMFPGVHEPLVTAEVFDRAQAILHGRVYRRIQKHHFTFSRLLKCRTCGLSLIGERQKGYVYYRCHTTPCPTTTVREDALDKRMLHTFSLVRLSDREKQALTVEADNYCATTKQTTESKRQALLLKQREIQVTLDRLTDALINGLIGKEAFNERRERLLRDQRNVEDRLNTLEEDGSKIRERVRKFVERSDSAYIQYLHGDSRVRRDLVRTITSNRIVEGKTLDFALDLPFSIIAQHRKARSSDPRGNRTPVTRMKT